MHCAHCRQPITGRFLRAGRLAFHPEHFLCRACQTPIVGDFNVHQGMFLHPACYAARHAPRCALCNEALTGRYVRHEGEPYHEACYGRHLAPKCDVCQRMIVGPSLTDAWGHTYHAEHAKAIASCLYCGKLTHSAIGGGGTTYGDGRVLCRGCHKTAVHREGDAVRLFASVRERMAAWGVETRDLELPLRLVDRKELSRLLAGGPHQRLARVSGFAGMQWEQAGREKTNKRATIYLLTGMPLGWYEATAAHELMHAWNFHHGPRHSFALEEGSCNYMSYRVHQGRADDPLARYWIDGLMQDPDPGYGVGFRKVKRYVERHGFERLLELLRRSADFPLLEGVFGIS